MNNIPAFLDRRNKTGEQPMTVAAASAKAPKTKRKDAYVCRAVISVPIDTADPDSYRKAVESVDGLLAELPTGSTIDFASRTIGKI